MKSTQIIGLKISGYKIVEELGSGTSTTTFRASDDQGKTIAVKRLNDSLAKDESLVAKFLNASELSSQIRMRKFLAIVSSQKKSSDGVFLLRGYVDGRPLSHYINDGSLDQLDAYQLSCDLCDGVRAMASRGVVHGGIHPNNVIITTAGRAVITDFGISACRLLGTVETGYAPSALKYLAPEQWQGKPPESKADVYSIGLIVAMLKSGSEVFQADDYKSLQTEIQAGAKIDCQVIAPAIHPKPARRYPDVSKFRSGLEGILKPPPESPAPPDKTTRDDPEKLRIEQEREKQRLAEKREKERQKQEHLATEKREQQEKQKEKDRQKLEQTRQGGTDPPPPDWFRKDRKTGSLKAIYDLNDGGTDILAKPPPHMFTIPRNGQRTLRALQLANQGDGPLSLNITCNGKGITVNHPQVEVHPGRMFPILITLEPDADEWVNASFQWVEGKEPREVEFKFYIPR